MVTIKSVLWFFLPILTLHAQQTRTKNQPLSTAIQSDSLASDSIRGAFFTVGSDFTSRVLFCGRDFGERQVGASPFLMYSIRGLYAYGILDFWNATPRKPARHVLGLGYESNPNKRVTFLLGYERWINHYDDPYFNNALKHELELGMDCKLRKISVEPTFYYFFGLEHIYELDVRLSRPQQIFKHKFRVFVTPEFTTTFATPVFAYMFYEFPDPGYDYEKFRLVDFEWGASLMLARKNLEFILAVQGNAPVRVANEVLTPFWYFTAALNFSF